MVAAGFGGFFVRGGTALDEYAMRAGGASERDAKVRINSLVCLELGVLALIVCVGLDHRLGARRRDPA